MPLRRLQRHQGTWAGSDDLHPAHVDRMRRAAETLAADHPGHGHLTYLEDRRKNQVVLLRTAAYSAAATPAEKKAAILYMGPAPRPHDHEVASALHTLSHAGINPLRAPQMREAYL